MLPAYIIEELRRREEAKKHSRPERQLELPLPHERPERVPSKEPSDRGVTIIDLF